jgi:transmembrane sensor
MSHVITERILYAYFEKRATPHEKLLVKEWLQNKENEEIFYQYMAVWESQHLQFEPDEKEARANFRAFLDTDKPYPRQRIFEKHRRIPVFNARVASVAASLIFLIAFALYTFQDRFFFEIHTTSYGMTKNVLLADGSEVTLNANSTLKVPNNLILNPVREVWLDGEAFFSVSKRPDKVRFLVHTTNLEVEVLGTKFNVNNRRGKTEVVLSEGRVKLTSIDDVTNPIIMQPGDYVSLAKNESVLRKKSVEPEAFTAWQSNELIFEDTPLRIVAEKIEDYYGVEVEFADDAIARYQLTGTLPNNDLGIVLRALKTSHRLTIERKGNKIIFR